MNKKTVLTDEEQRKELIAQLDEELAARRENVLKRASEVTVSSLHGKIGGKNNKLIIAEPITFRII